MTTTTTYSYPFAGWPFPALLVVGPFAATIAFAVLAVRDRSWEFGLAVAAGLICTAVAYFYYPVRFALQDETVLVTYLAGPTISLSRSQITCETAPTRNLLKIRARNRLTGVFLIAFPLIRRGDDLVDALTKREPAT